MELDIGAFVSVFEPFNHLGFVGLLALLGIYSGVFLLFRGFRMLQHKRLVLNTPLSKIRSASMGLVEVSGMAAGPQTIPAGITGEPCFYYHATAWQQAESDRQRGWEKVVDESVGVPFFVDDGTGRMLVYPQGAKLDIHRNFREEYGASFFSTREMVPESVRKFLLRHGIAPSGTIRLEQRCILPGYPLFVFGTLGERIWPLDAGASCACSTAFRRRWLEFSSVAREKRVRSGRSSRGRQNRNVPRYNLPPSVAG
jgi:hypothetical protein